MINHVVLDRAFTTVKAKCPAMLIEEILVSRRATQQLCNWVDVRKQGHVLRTWMGLQREAKLKMYPSFFNGSRWESYI